MSYRLIPDPTGMSCTVVASDAAHGYTIMTTYVADPGSDSVLMRVHFSGPSGDQLYVRLDPLAGGTGGGGTQNAGGNSATLAGGRSGAIPVAFNTNTTTNAVNRTYAVPTFEALESADGFSAASVGYADTASDGLTMLDSRPPADHLRLGARRSRGADRGRAPAARAGRPPSRWASGRPSARRWRPPGASVRRSFARVLRPLRVRLGAL